MLGAAREKLPEKTPLYLADMSCFRLDVKFDAIICVYHGVNHLLDFTAWEGFFDCVHEHLNAGGVFAFDTLTKGNLQSMASGPKIVQRFGENYLHLTVRSSGETVFDWNVEVFELQQDGGYELLTQVIRTATFPPERILAALGERFRSIEIIESDGGVNDDGEDRIWFVCTKPQSAVQQRPSRTATVEPPSGLGTGAVACSVSQVPRPLAADGMVALGRLSPGRTELGGVRDRDCP